MMQSVMIAVIAGIVSSIATHWWLQHDVHRYIEEVMRQHEVDLVKSLEHPYDLEIH